MSSFRLHIDPRGEVAEGARPNSDAFKVAIEPEKISHPNCTVGGAKRCPALDGRKTTKSNATMKDEDNLMSDESRLDQAAARAAHAQELLDNELLTDAFKTLEESYASAWRSTVIEDVSAREKLFLAINVLGKVKDHLNAVVANGKLAQAELKEIAQTAERRKRFGIL